MSDAGRKVILVTGCTSGIGLEVSKYLYEQGYSVLLVGRNEEKLKVLSDELNQENWFVCDFEYLEQIQELFSYCKANEIKLSGMVHCAGYAINMPVRVYKEDDMKKQMQVHYYAFNELCKHFYSKRISDEGASIVALSSMAAITRRKGSTLYAASKSALNAAVSVISKEFLKRSIRVNAIMPAYVNTRMNDGIEELIDFKERQPLGMIEPRDIAYLVEFLLSDKSKYITGAFIPVSAGMEE